MQEKGVNEICMTCLHKKVCGQPIRVRLVTCPNYKYKKQGRKFETGRSEYNIESPQTSPK